MSLGAHVLLITLLGLALSRVPRGTGEQDGERPIGIAMVHRLPDREQFEEVTPQDDRSDQAEANDASAAAAAAPPADFAPPLDLNGMLRAVEATPSPNSGSGLAGETQLDGDAFGPERGAPSPTEPGKTTTTVFGVSGSGSRFVYVFDRSDSMNGYEGRPLRAAKSELIRSLSSLTDAQRFQIVFYNDKPTQFRLSENAPMQTVAGEAPYIAQAKRFVNSIAAYGGTEHAPALKMALAMDPDVVFFLTDARVPRLSSAELREIQARADRSGTAIHAIEFGADPSPPADSFLRDLAAMNRGQYRYLDVRRLSTRRQEAQR